MAATCRCPIFQVWPFALQAMQPPARAPSTSQIWTKNTQYSDDNKKNTEFCHNSPGCFHGVVIECYWLFANQHVLMGSSEISTHLELITFWLSPSGGLEAKAAEERLREVEVPHPKVHRDWWCDLIWWAPFSIDNLMEHHFYNSKLHHNQFVEICLNLI